MVAPDDKCSSSLMRPGTGLLARGRESIMNTTGKERGIDNDREFHAVSILSMLDLASTGQKF